MTLTSASDSANKSKNFLQKIAELRAHGIGDHISLPQLVVCGDQSAGKSSVLEGITGIPFPRNDGVCTKFATEITLTHNDEGDTKISATIIPHASRSEEERAFISSFSRPLSSFADLPSVISEVGEIMGLRGFGKKAASAALPAFGADVLSIKVSGPTGRHLTVVDLPGLIVVANDEQTTDDVKLVERLVDDYIKSPRTIIVAIVQAGNDIANQRIIQKARQVDTNGERTVGVITKPDLINVGTEKRIAMLSRNEDTTKLKRGFFIVKNPAPKDLEGGDMTSEARRQMEHSFFTSPPWSEQRLDKDRVGTSRLLTYLQNILDKHIERELPKVYAEIRLLLAQTEDALMALGPERKSPAEMKAYLAQVSLQFHDLCRQGLDGHYAKYGDTLFKYEETRLRAQVHILNSNFAWKMRVNGAKRKCFAEIDESDLDEDNESENEKSLQERLGDEWILETYHRTRGQELQGTYNSVLLAELFHEQSSPWLNIAKEHLQNVFGNTSRFVKKALEFLVKDEQVRRRLLPEVQELLSRSHSEAKLELARLWNDEQRFPMTYNHYYTENVQKARRDELQSSLDSAIAGAFENAPNSEGRKWLYLDTLQMNVRSDAVTVDMEDQACKEATAALKAYYKVTLKTFVDNVCRQVVERHILTDLSEIFSPVSVMKLSNEKVEHLAAESDEVQQKRQELETLRAQLESGLSVLI
ncbi:Dynamin [Orbilia brochopaga]|nr:Dynamin [Drechslerella brochopaga]